MRVGLSQDIVLKIVVPRGGHLMRPNRGTATAQPTRPAGGRNKCWRGGPAFTSTVASAPGSYPDRATVSGGVYSLWDANSTPVCWGCQDGSPTYCRLKP